ncbi:MAG: PQQ-like beta-propeller repeat protein [Planctomycetes bacterium]|nr:PQQ-like beta-propeller repeat protein [Planctomycetota bacterium]
MRYAIMAGLAGIAVGCAAAGDWPQWRGPTLDGVSPDRNLPTKWSETHNILWKVPLPSWGAATPIVSGERVFVMSASTPDASGDHVDQEDQNRTDSVTAGGPNILLICLQPQDGQRLWERRLATGNTLYRKHNMASPSPVADGKHVWTLTGTGVLTAFDLDGNQKWQRDLQQQYSKFGLKYGYASSPLLFENLVIVQVLHGTHTSEPSHIVAFEAASGKVVWQHERRTDADQECPDAYTTPTLSTQAGRTDLIISGADYVTGHDPRTGREIWRAGGLNPDKRGNYRICASPVPVADLIIVPSRVTPVLALRAGGLGDVTESHRAWQMSKGGPDVPTPVSDGKYLYVVNDQGLATCLDVRSGAHVWGPERTARGAVSASPLLADGKLYTTNEQAVTTVLKAGPRFEILATNELAGENTLSSLAAADGCLFLRTASHLYCIGGSRK